MNLSQPAPRPVNSVRIAAFASAVIGAALVLVALLLDWSGFWGGVAQGAGIALVVMAAYLLGLVAGMRRGGGTRGWRPGSASSGSAA